MIHIKLKAQKTLIGKNKKAFFVSILPFLMMATLLCLNYYLLKFMKNNAEIFLLFKMLIAVCVAMLSLFMINTTLYISENYFYRKATDSFAPVRAIDLFCSFAVNILKTLLFFSWSAVFFLPCVALLFCAYSAKTNNYAGEIVTTLYIAAAIMALVGAGCFFVLFGRYSKCNFIQFTTGETNPVKVLARSSEIMEENQIRYSLFRLSFLGWNLSCLLLFPIIYVLPYRKCAKYVFFNTKPKQKQKEPISEKPIVFIFG